MEAQIHKFICIVLTCKLARTCIMKIFVFRLHLDPRAAATANLFMDAMCIGEKIINDKYCFVL
ncbi:hypothetical protein ACB092_01G138600 [Castanea dentata]